MPGLESRDFTAPDETRTPDKTTVELVNMAGGQIGRYTFQPGWKWSECIGYTTLGGAGNYVLLVDESGQQPKLLLQHVDETKTGKNRMHFDIETPTVDEEVARLEDLGAKRIEADAIEEHGNRWVVMADPEGNEFCVCNAGQPDA